MYWEDVDAAAMYANGPTWEKFDLGSVSIHAIHQVWMGMRAWAAGFRRSLFLVSMWSC